MIRIEISVVKVGEELLFKSGEILFDCLTAQTQYYDGKITIMRDGAIYDETTSIYEYGTHGAGPAFIGLKKKGCGYYAEGDLLPADFQEGDLLVLEIPQDEKFSFPDFLQIQYLHHKAMKATFDRLPKGTVGELRKVFSEEIKRVAQEYRQNPNIGVLRW